MFSTGFLTEEENYFFIANRTPVCLWPTPSNNGVSVAKGIPSADINVGNLDEYVGRHGNKFKRFLEK